VGELPAANTTTARSCRGGACGNLGRLKAKLADLLGFDEREIDVSRPVRDLRIDSISVIQLAAQFGRAAAELQPQDIFNYPSIEALATDLARPGSGNGATASTSRTETIAARTISAQSAVQGRLLQWRQPARKVGRLCCCRRST